MPSTLGRLYAYAKSSKSEALENFATEALAAAIRDDWRPITRLLREVGLLGYDQEPETIGVETQVALARAGILDLVLVIVGGGSQSELWIEVKVSSPESGSQLTEYGRVISTLVHKPRLAVLSPYPLRGHAHLPWITWQAVYGAAARQGGDSPYWRDLGVFLKEIGMANEFDEPIVAGEAASLLAAHALYQKVSRIVASTLDVGKARWPALGWPKSANDADEQLLWQFKGWRRITVPVRTSGPAKIFLGIAQVDASAEFAQPEPHLCVWVEHAAKQIDLRRAILDRADVGELPAAWERRVKGWWALTAHERLGAFPDHTTAVAWLVQRLEELDRAGLLAMLTTAATSAIRDDEVPAQ